MHTKNLKKYFLRLLLFALLAQFPYMLYTTTIGLTPNLNILFTLLLGLCAIYIYEKSPNPWLGFLGVILSCILAQYALFDYGWYGIACIFVFHLLKEKKIAMFITFTIITFINYFYQYITSGLYPYLLIFVFCSLAALPLSFYNKAKGKSIKYFFYIFYPLHLLLLYALSFVWK